MVGVRCVPFRRMTVASFDPLDISTHLLFRIDGDLLVVYPSRGMATSLPPPTSRRHGFNASNVVGRGFKHRRPVPSLRTVSNWTGGSRGSESDHPCFRHVAHSYETSFVVQVPANVLNSALVFFFSHALDETKRRPFVDCQDPSRLRSCIGSGYVATRWSQGPVRHERCRGRVQVVGGWKRHEPRPCQKRYDVCSKQHSLAHPVARLQRRVEHELSRSKKDGTKRCCEFEV